MHQNLTCLLLTAAGVDSQGKLSLSKVFISAVIILSLIFLQSRLGYSKLMYDFNQLTVVTGLLSKLILHTIIKNSISFNEVFSIVWVTVNTAHARTYTSITDLHFSINNINIF